MLDDFDDSQLKDLGAAATSSKQYRMELYAFEAAHLLVSIAICIYVVLYIRSSLPPVTHRAFLLFVLFVAIPLAFVQVRRLVHGRLFDRALKRQATALGLLK